MMYFSWKKFLTVLEVCIVFHLCVNTFISCDLSQENGTSVSESFPKQKCESLLVNCSCYDYEELAGIVCNKLDDFSKISRLLSSDDIFEVNNTYEITFNEVKYLPAQVLRGLIVYRLFLDDPEMAAIDEGAFEGVIRLRRFHVRRSKIENVPDFRKIKNSIRSINIDSSRLTVLEGEYLQDLTLVTRLSFVNNSIRYIDPNVFQGTENVLIFDISHNLLTFIPPNLLNPWKNLLKFVASYNNLLHVDQLFAMTHPKFIFLDYNNITDVDSVLHYNMTAVEEVALSGNPLEKITEDAFNEKVPNIRFLYLDHCKIRHFNESHYNTLANLATLDLSYNLLEEIEGQYIDFGYKMELIFIGNQIKKFDAKLSFKIKRLFINENKLQILGTTLQYTQIIEVSVARNEIKYLTNEDFRSVHATENLELQGNRIEWIDRFTFVSIRNNLHYLDLSSNFLPSLNGSVKYLSQLKLLNLTDNLIQTFSPGEFTGLNELSELYLQHNQIVALSGQLQQLPQLQYLVITHNNIETLAPEQIPKNLKFMYLGDNPFKCDCRLFPFLLWMNASDSLSIDIDLCVHSTEEKQMNNSFHRKITTCPEMCSCGCMEDGNTYFMSVDCNSKNLSDVPSFLASNFVQIQENTSITFDFRRSLLLDQNVYSSLDIRDRVLSINLENNSLQSLETAQMPPELLQLFLADNKLRRIPERLLYTLQNLKQVSLSQNPWECDCNALEFKKWMLSKMDVITDINITYCGSGYNGESVLSGRAMWKLTDLDLCPTDIGMIISLAFGILVFLSLCLVTKILYTKYELNIKVFLYSHGITWVKQRDLDHDKKFDAFISFSHKDEAFVTKEIISVIENKDPNIRLCVHYRHFRPGEFIHDNIIFAVQNSKRTILVLSRNFLESEWCLMEFRAAHVQALEDKVHRIIVVKVGDLPKEMIDPAIKVYLDSTTYLTWGERYFWNNLLYVLPTAPTNNIKKELFVDNDKVGDSIMTILTDKQKSKLDDFVMPIITFKPSSGK